MADFEQTSRAKKNRKKKPVMPVAPKLTPQEQNKQNAQQLLNVLREQLEKAKSRKEHAIADTLRKQLWVVRDIAHGVKPDMPYDLLRDIINELPLEMPGEEGIKRENIRQGPTITPTERKIKKLLDRLEQIEKLKERQANGEKLENNQMTKIESESSTRQELEDLQKIMTDLKVS